MICWRYSAAVVRLQDRQQRQQEQPAAADANGGAAGVDVEARIAAAVSEARAAAEAEAGEGMEDLLACLGGLVGVASSRDRCPPHLKPMRPSNIIQLPVV